MHKALTMSVSGSCKLVWIISPGINEILSMATVDPAEKARYEPSHLHLHYLCGYPYQSIGSEGLTLVPTCDSSIWGRAWQILLLQKTVRLSKIWISLHAYEFFIVRISLISAYQRAPPDQKVTCEDSDLASLINTGWSESLRTCRTLTFLKDSILFRQTVLNIEEYIQTIN